MEQVLSILLVAAAVYLLCGFLFAIPFLLKGVDQTDPEGATGAGWGFRLIILPGILLFWPVLLRKWIQALKKKND